jgi:NitT/TauT family transport system permease protein
MTRTVALFLRRSQAAVRLRSAALFGALLVAWEIAATHIPQRATIFPAPSQILATIINNYPIFLRAVRPTVYEAVVGFTIASVIAISLALAFVRWSAIEESLHNVAVTLNSVPYLAIIPLLVIWLGPGYGPKIVIAALATFFPVLVNATRGLKAADPQLLEFMHVLNATWWQTVVKVRFQMALPYLFAGFKISAPAAVLGATIGEWIGSRTGIGYLILTSMFEFNVLMLWSTMVVSAAVAISGFLLFAGLERLIVGRWHEPAEAGTESE